MPLPTSRKTNKQYEYCLDVHLVTNCMCNQNPQVSVADVEPVRTKLTTRRGHKQIGKFLFLKKMEFFDVKMVLGIQTIINEFNIEWIFLTT